MKLPPVHDIARLLCRKHEDTVQRLVQYFTEGGGGFNYSHSQRAARHIFEGTIPIEIGVDACHYLRPKAARKPNAEVLEGVGVAGRGRKVRTHVVKARNIGVRRDLLIPIAPTFLFVEDEFPSLFWLQPRRYHALDRDQLALVASVFQRGYLTDDFEHVGLEMLDLSVPDGCQDRGHRTFRLGDLDLRSEGEVDSALNRFALAFDEVSAMGIKKRARRPRNARDGAVDDMFGG